MDLSPLEPPRTKPISESYSFNTQTSCGKTSLEVSTPSMTHRNTIIGSSPNSPGNWPVKGNGNQPSDQKSQNHDNFAPANNRTQGRRYSCPNTREKARIKDFQLPRIQLNNETIKSNHPRNSYSYPKDPYEELAPFDHKLDDIQEDISIIKQKNILAKKNIRTFKNIANKVGQLGAILVLVSLILAIPENALGKTFSLEWKLNIAMIIAYILFISVLETRQYTKRAFGVDDFIGGFEKCQKSIDLQVESVNSKHSRRKTRTNHRSRTNHASIENREDDQIFESSESSDQTGDPSDPAATTQLLSPTSFKPKVEFDYKPVIIEVSKSVVYITGAIKLIEVYHANPKNNESAFSVIGLLGFMAAMMCGSLHIGLGLGLYFLEKDTVDMKSQLLETQMNVEMKRQETIRKRPDLFLTAAHVRKVQGSMMSARARLAQENRQEERRERMSRNREDREKEEPGEVQTAGQRFNLVPFMMIDEKK